MNILTEQFQISEEFLFYLPFLIDEESIPNPKGLPSFNYRDHFVSIGNFLHPPNWDSVQYLKNEIWLGIRKELPNVELHIYGAYPSQKVFQLHDEKNGFLIKGRAENSAEVVKNAKVLLAPLRFGAGLKGKLFEAMLCGTPSVTTSIGAEGMNGKGEWSGKIEDTHPKFIHAAIELYKDETEWENAQKIGFKLIRELFLRMDYDESFNQKIDSLIKNLSMHRKSNFLGNLLQSQAFSSTKYMSRWIEEKNKRD